MTEHEIFVAAIKLEDAARAEFVKIACGADERLRREVDSLLAAHDSSGGVLPKRGVDLLGATDLVGGDPHPGTVIAGRYKLIELIGEGGMGMVYMAQQIEPVKRVVALKLIKPGMDSKQILARFEAERQALALMDHPNIAKVLDGGITERGQPFFLMELVKGVPITKFCDERRLTLRERLALFVPVCQAIQHAHHKGVIHRDIKPSNVLIALYDGNPVPKVIDFGVAKATGQQLTEATLVTGFGAVIGTPEYMSPEQAELNQLDIDTRSDVYSLGVLLFEILTGTTPVDRKSLGKAAVLEILRIVREEEPPTPSTRLSQSQSLASIAAARKIEPLKLAKMTRGELDWIVMKCLEKERRRRYETVNGLAQDIERFLADEQVQAVPPSTFYRWRKFARKNRTILATVTAFMVLLIVFASTSSWLALKASHAEKVADDRRIEAESNAKTAADQSALHGKASLAHFEARIEAESLARRLQAELDIEALKQDTHVGLLRLAKPYKQDLKVTYKAVSDDPIMQEFLNGAESEWDDDKGTIRALREFAKIAVLTNGQNFAPLLPPITHQGTEVLNWKITETGNRLLTLGKDGTARLWDVRTSQPVAILQKSGEQVTRCGFSPDGQTAFTDTPDGAVLLWNTGDGSYRAETERRPVHVIPESQTGYADANNSTYQTADVTHLSDTRVITRSIAEGFPERLQFAGPVELWDSRTGRLIARYEDHGAPGVINYQFVGDGRFLTAIEGTSTVVVISAEHGREVARLNHPGEKLSTAIELSPAGKWIETITDDPEAKDGGVRLHFWDTSTWQEHGVSTRARVAGKFITDKKLCGTLKGLDTFFDLPNWIYEIGREEPVFHFDAYDYEARSDGDNLRIMASVSASVFGTPNVDLLDGRTGQRLVAPDGRRFHPDLARFTTDGRFALSPIRDGIVDLRVDKIIPFSLKSPFASSIREQPNLGWTAIRNESKDAVFINIIPTRDLSAITFQQLELWAKVAIRGTIAEDGRFVKWDEHTWEEKRQELAAISPPYADFPFPGYVATDKLHWLRAEYHSSNEETEKVRIAKELLRRAEANGDNPEAARWRTILTPAVDQEANPVSD